MLNITLVGDKELVQKLEAMPDKVEKSIVGAMYEFVEEVRNYVITQKLSGQVLNHITGNLWRSIQTLVTTAAKKIVGKVYASADCKYAAIHEFGGVIHRHARMQTIYRRINRSGELGNRFVRKARANIATDHRVGDYTIHMPERSYLRSSLKDKKDAFQDRMRRAVSEGIKA